MRERSHRIAPSRGILPPLRLTAGGALPIVLLLLLLTSTVPAAPSPGADGAAPGGEVDAGVLDAIDGIVEAGIASRRMPGAVVVIGHRDRVLFRRAYGSRTLHPEPRPMEVDTVFDLASLTKPIATATSIHKLAEQGRLDLDAPVQRYLPAFAASGKEGITVRHLLTHTGGLPPANSLADYADGVEEARARLLAIAPREEPGASFTYTDVGFIVLGLLVEELSGVDVGTFARRELFSPLGMEETGFRPASPLAERAAVTEQREGRWMRGEVHDPRAHALGGVAGHAGLFSTADDLARYARMLLRGGELDGVRVLAPETVERMTRPVPVPGGLRSLGWDVRTRFSSHRGDLNSPRAFGHGGFTGTSIWIDPELDLFVIVLSNRVHPDGSGKVNPIIGRIGTLAGAALSHRAVLGDPPPPSPVRTGIDVLHGNDYALLRGKRIGLITNHTGLDRTGTSTVRRLLEAEGVDLVTIFSPEHGFTGTLDIARIDDTTDPTSGLQVISLYGETRQPTAEHLAGLEAIVFDIREIGARFYTYVSTMGLAMEAASRAGKAFIVLDRPNPIGGTHVEGPVLDAGLESFVGFHPVCVRHGMTIGELARMIATERGWDLDLTVIPCEGWQRHHWFDATGLRWLHPSPNIRNLTQATLYPGVGLLETTNLSVGRGTDAPFELLGAPWIDAAALAAAFNAAGLAGVRAIPVHFTPESSKFAGEICHGLNLIVTDRLRLEPVRMGLTLATFLRRLHPEAWETTALNRLLCDTAVRDAIVAGETIEKILPLFEAERAEFLARRARFLLY